ncbi:single-stranded DNA-binding protein [Microbacterium sp. GXF7504]
MSTGQHETVTVVGNVGGTPERRQTPAGPVTSFRLGSTHRRLDRQSGEWVDDYTNWFSVNVWRALGQHAFASLRKGDRVLVTGRLRAREWETDAKRGVSLEIDASALGHDLLWGTTEFTRDRSGGGRAEAPAEAAPATATAGDWGAPATTGADAWATATIPDGTAATEQSAAAREPAETPF